MASERTLHRPEPEAGRVTPLRGRLRVLFRSPRALGFLAGVVLVIGGAALVVPHLSSDATSEPAEVPVEWQRPAVSADSLADQIGVRLTQVSVTGGGGLLDLRYQVVDPEKAESIHDDSTPPAIIDEATGLVVNQLLMGHSHKGELEPAVSYYLIFESPGNLVRPGSTVTVLLGDAQVEHVVVS